MNREKTLYFLLLIAVMTVVLTGSYASAASIDETNNTEILEDSMQTEHTRENTVIEKKDMTTKNYKRANPQQDISLYSEDIECDYGETVNIDVVTEPEVDEGVLSWFIEDMLVGAKNLSRSDATLELETGNYEPGVYTILVSYTSSLNYANNQTSATLTINKIPTTITNVNSRFDLENNINVSLSVEGYNQERLDFGTLRVYYDNTLLSSIDIEDADVSFILDKRYNMEVLRFGYTGDVLYDDTTAEEVVYAEKYDTNIYLPYMYCYQSSVISQDVTFYTERQVNDGKINVYIDDILVDNINVRDNNPLISIDTTNYLAGNYTVQVEYVDSDVFNDAHYTTTLSIRQIATTLYTDSITAHKNDVITLRATVYNYVDQTSEGIVEFLLDDESIKTTIVTNATVRESYLLPDNMEYGVHTVKVIYYGTSRYLPSQAVATLNLTRYSNSLSLRNCTLDDDGKIVLNIRAYSYANDVDDGEVEVYVNGTLTSHCNVTGNITEITLPEEYIADNTYEVMVRYYGSERFDDANLTTTISPERYETSTRLYTFITKENILNITSYVYSTSYDEINEGSVRYYINDTLIATVNVTNNSANLVIDMDSMEEKQYTIRAEYTGTRLYRNSENTTTISYEINRKNIYIRTDGQIRTTPGKDITVYARLTDYEENTINLTTQATISILGENITAQFTEGILNQTYHIQASTTEGTYNITIKTDQTKYYKNTTGNIKLTVAKNTPYITATSSITATKADTIIINATLNLNGEKLEENITAIVKINNKTVYQGRFMNGQLEYKLKLTEKYSADTYNITIKSKETTFYHSAQKNITLNLRSRNTYITSKNIISKNGEKIIINATVYDSTTRTQVKGNAKACIKINEVTLDNINITNGRIIYSYTKNYSAKNYSIHIIYGQNSIYNHSEWMGTLTITATPVKIVTENIMTNAYSTVNIKARILDENSPATGTIKTAIKINNITIKEQNLTDGTIDFNYTLPDELPAGTHNLTIIAGDSHRYTGNTSTVSLIVYQNYKHITADNITATPDTTVTIRADILDINNKPVTEKTKVNIKIAGKTVTDMNVTDGHIVYNYTLPSGMKKGIYDILIQAGENQGYVHATTNTILKVE